jgi:hypothetical protein
MKIFLLALFLLPFSLLAQQFPTDSTTGKITYTGVVQVDGTNKADLYARAREWFTDNFKSADAVLEMEDKEAGILVGKAYSDITGMTATMMHAMKMWYNVKVEVKDNRYRYTINQIQLQNYFNKNYPAPADAQTQMIPGENFFLAGNNTKKGKVNKPLIQGKEKAKTILEGLTTSLKTKMATKSDF